MWKIFKWNLNINLFYNFSRYFRSVKVEHNLWFLLDRLVTQNWTVWVVFFSTMTVGRVIFKSYLIQICSKEFPVHSQLCTSISLPTFCKFLLLAPGFSNLFYHNFPVVWIALLDCINCRSLLTTNVQFSTYLFISFSFIILL